MIFDYLNKTARFMCSNRQCTVAQFGTDKYGRVLGQVTCAGIDANADWCRDGLGI